MCSHMNHSLLYGSQKHYTVQNPVELGYMLPGLGEKPLTPLFSVRISTALSESKKSVTFNKQKAYLCIMF